MGKLQLLDIWTFCVQPPEGFPLPVMPELPNEHGPGLYDLNAS